MKSLLLSLGLLLSSFFVTAQVGINTTDPTTTLDVNGSVRVRALSEEVENGEYEFLAEKIVGIDANGNMTPVTLGDNVYLENNQIKAISNRAAIGDITAIGISVVNNLNLVIWPGEPNDDKSVIRIQSLLGDIDITGIAAGNDGQVITLYPVDGRIRLFSFSILSLPANQIANQSGSIIIEQYDMVKLMYDGTINKWVIMNK